MCNFAGVYVVVEARAGWESAHSALPVSGFRGRSVRWVAIFS